MGKKEEEYEMQASTSGATLKRTDSSDSEYEAKEKYPVPEYKGDPGPISQRKCRDVFWLILFILFWGGMVAVGIYAATIGNPTALLYATDSEGNTCGVDNTGKPNTGGRDLTDMRYLYYYTYNTTSEKVLSRCVTECPDYTYVPDVNEPVDSSKIICDYDVTASSNYVNYGFQVSNFTCGALTYSTESLLMRCFPLNITITPLVENVTSSAIAFLNSRGISVDLYTNLYENWVILLACAAFTFVFAFVWLLFLQWFTSLMVWLTVMLGICAALGITAYCWACYASLNGITLSIMDWTFTVPAIVIRAYNYNRWVFLGVAIFWSVFTAILLLLVIFLRKRISLAAAVIMVASRAVRSMPSIFLVPIIKMLLLLGVTGWVVWTAVNLASAGDVTTINVEGYGYAVTYESDYLIQWLQLYTLFGFFWGWNMVIAIGKTVIAGAVAGWYWTKNKNNLPWFLVGPSWWRVIRYHLGSLAFGSFIIAVVQFIRYLLRKAERKLNKSHNVVIKFIFKILQCCFLCVERFLKFLTKNAYIEIAIYGYSFCKAARVAFQLVVRNIIRVIVLDKIGSIIFFLTEVLLTCVTAILGNYLLINYSPNKAFWVLPLVVITIVAFGIAVIFTDILRMACSTVFLCFCEDVERHDGSPERPYYMPEKLQKFVDRRAKESTDLARP